MQAGRCVVVFGSRVLGDVNAAADDVAQSVRRVCTNRSGKKANEKNTPAFAQTLNKLKAAVNRPRFGKPSQGIANYSQGREHHFLPKAKRSSTSHPLLVQGGRHVPTSLSQASFTSANQVHPEHLFTAPHSGNSRQNSSSLQFALRSRNSNLGWTFTAAPLRRVQVVHRLRSTLSSQPSRKPIWTVPKIEKANRGSEDERPSSWDWRSEPELALKTYSAVIRDGLETLAADRTANEPPESLLQF
ncbi:hypothetical protein M407DRAFT_11235 [Tulasnella calospora MUT 4182]|uniref:Uncharacterized protein n=1 Tax=Tulasnella calospora MUT 4182 TaxID=1051891 RepID=A0A0C3Q7Z5_9AGAM|nr:hypothetical protein M407DRAFT_11235 [Tulasnella calospora MUT 4182]